MNKYKICFSLAFAILYFAGSMAQNQFEVLLYTKPNPYHDPAIITAVSAFENMADKHQFSFTWTQLENSFDDDLSQNYDVIIFFNTNSRFFNESQKNNLKKFVNNGGGVVAIHGAAVSIGDWEWFKNLVGRVFRANILIQSGIIEVQNKDFPASYHLPDRWLWTEEWYLYGDALTENQTVLMTLNESSIEAIRSFSDVRMDNIGTNNPLSWYQKFDGGRCFYTALGHQAGAFTDPEFLKHLFGGIYWAATGKGFSN